MVKPKFIYVDKKTNNLIMEIPAVGKVLIEDKRGSENGKVTATLLRGGKSKIIGEIPYNLLTGETVAVREFKVKEDFQFQGIARAMFGVLESNSQGKVVMTKEAFDNAARILQTFSYNKEKSRLGDFPTYWRETKDAEKWKKKTNEQIRKKKSIHRR